MGLNNFQRTGAVSNSHVGRDFERRSWEALRSLGIEAEFDFRVPVGLSGHKKAHRFDLGSHSPKLVVECKSQTWTSGGNVPSAKMKNWAEAMFYFHMTPPEYRKIFIVEQSIRPRTGQSLLAYFLRTQAHLVPDGVEFWELAPANAEPIIHRVAKPIR